VRNSLGRDGILGLLIFGSVVAIVGTFYWVRGGVLGEAGFKFVVRFPQASRLTVGSSVRFRGVQVGRVTGITPQTNAVEVQVAIDNPKLAIPLQSSVETIQGTLLGNTDIEIFPQTTLTAGADLDPTSPNCNAQLIICNGQTVSGSVGVSFTELLRDSGRFFRRINDDELFNDLRSTLKNASIAAENISKLTTSFNRLLGVIDREIVKFGDTTAVIAQAAENVGNAANSADAVIRESRDKLAQTLDSIANASREAEALLANARPLFQDGKLIADLQQLATSAAATASNLRKITGEFSDPVTLNTLKETIESARATFANAQKITTDIDELTGDPRFRRNLRNLIEGLTGLVSDAPRDPPTEVANTKEHAAESVNPEK
jgi:phospholipid/cholesterol/gamma-HCH transport system substrate-binding protein